MFSSDPKGRRFLAATLFSVVAGITDTTTGALLLTNPEWTLELMGIRGVALADLFGNGVLLRFVGAFVGSIGLAYLYPWLLTSQPWKIPTRTEPSVDPRFLRRLTTVFEVTCLVRVSVACFVAAATASGSLSLAWLSISATDLSFAAFQFAVLRGAWLDSPRTDRRSAELSEATS